MQSPAQSQQVPANYQTEERKLTLFNHLIYSRMYYAEHAFTTKLNHAYCLSLYTMSKSVQEIGSDLHTETKCGRLLLSEPTV